MPLTHVLAPIRIGSVDIRNRVVSTAHVTRLALQSFDDLIEYHVRRAEGGVGLTILELLAVHRSAPYALNAFNPEHVQGCQRMMQRLKPLGMKVFQQLWHGGHHVMPLDGSPPWSASDQPSPVLGIVPLAMTHSMIDEIVTAFADAARRCEEWGLDGIELHAAHGYLPQQFLSPNTNKRDDHYGGSLENRARFTLEILAAIRDSVSSKMAVCLRIGPDDTFGGAGVGDNLRLLELAQARSLIDMVSISLGNKQAYHKMMGGMHEPVGYELPTSIAIGKHAKVPTLVIGRVRTLEEADTIVRQGDGDLVGMTRAHIADPDIVHKTLKGHPEQVRPCIGCNQGCVGGGKSINPRIGCTVNAGAGWERTYGDHALKPAAVVKRVLVVGGGPAGMEAARVSVLRGHQVTLAQAESVLGGSVLIAAKAPTRSSLRDITMWMEQEIYRLGVKVLLSTYIEAEEATAERFDEVILATGSTPRMDGIQVSNPGEPILGMQQAHVFSSHDVLLDDRLTSGARTALVIDESGHYEAVAVTEALQLRGISVTFVTSYISFAPKMDSALMNEPALQRIARRGNFMFHARTRVISIEKGFSTIGPTYLNAQECQMIPSDIVVFISPNRPNRDLYQVLTSRGMRVQVVGDANSPRNLLNAIREGHLAGANL